MALLALDSETWLIEPGTLGPPLVCVTYYDGERRGILHHTEALTFIENALYSETIIGANISYDLGVFAAKWPHLLHSIFRAYDEGRIRDVQLRQKLIDNAHGYLEGGPDKSGKWVKYTYSLDALCQRLLGRKLDKDTWWHGYQKLHDIPCELWPKGAVEYAVDDAVAAWDVYSHQEVFRDRQVLEDEQRQSAAQWALHLMSMRGVRTDPAHVEKFTNKVMRNMTLLQAKLLQQGLLRGPKVRLGKKTKATLRKAKKTQASALFARLVDKGRFNQDDDPPEIVGKITRDTKAAKARVVLACQKLGIEPKLTDKGQISLDEDQCSNLAAIDSIMADYGAYSALVSVASKDLPILKIGTSLPIQTSYEVLKETGRTSSKDPKPGRGGTRTVYGANMQNLRRLFGIRECFVPRAGYYYADADYDGQELRTFAQCCKIFVGFSKLADALNAGLDVHLELGSRLAKMASYAYAKEALKGLHGPEEKKKISDARQLAKVANFGFPGGMSAAGFMDFARRGYKLLMTLEEAENLRNNWLETWPEAGLYFRYVRSLLNQETNEANICQLFSLRWRGRTRYTAACNSFFQGLASDASKCALYAVTRACYAEPESPLYGSYPVLFIHDQIICEVPQDRAHEAAVELGRLMREEGSRFVPDVPLTTEPCLTTCYSKSAQAQYDKDKRLVPWSPEERLWDEMQEAA